MMRVSLSQVSHNKNTETRTASVAIPQRNVTELLFFFSFFCNQNNYFVNRYQPPPLQWKHLFYSLLNLKLCSFICWVHHQTHCLCTLMNIFLNLTLFLGWMHVCDAKTHPINQMKCDNVCLFAEQVQCVNFRMYVHTAHAEVHININICSSRWM